MTDMNDEFFSRCLAIFTTPSVPLVMAVTSLVACVLIWWAAAAVYRDAQWIEAERRRRAQERTERCWDEATGEEWRWDNEPVTEILTAPMPVEDLRRIVGALIVETSEARELVRKGRTKEALGGLHQVIGCLNGLLERCGGEVRS